MSTLLVNNIDTATGTTITVPTGKELIVTDEGAIRAPGMIVNFAKSVVTGNTITSSTSFVATGLSITYTPKRAGNDLLVQATMGGDTNAANRSIYLTIFRDSTDLGAASSRGFNGLISSTGGRLFVPGYQVVVDENVTSAARTYTVYGRSGNGSQIEIDGTTSIKTITVMEIER